MSQYETYAAAIAKRKAAQDLMVNGICDTRDFQEAKRDFHAAIEVLKTFDQDLEAYRGK